MRHLLNRLHCWLFGHDVCWKWMEGEWVLTYCHRCGAHIPPPVGGEHGLDEYVAALRGKSRD